ncbi:MAG: peptidyl-dipeptidase [Acidobacteriota bacterium]|nr:peptidyl-dipeptidase [Acidobacteriota bacterium]
MREMKILSTTALLLLAATAANAATPETKKPMTSTATITTSMPGAPTVDDAKRFVDDAEARLAAMNVEQQRAEWVAENFITYDTQIITAAASERQTALGVALAKEAARFDQLQLPYDLRRKLDLIKLALTTPGPGDPQKNAELSRILAELSATYGSGKYCPPGASGDKCLDIETITEIMQTSRDPKRLLEVWNGWHTVSKPMRAPYSRFVELTNEGAHELGYKDAGAMWRSKYDMPPDAFTAEVDRLWTQVKPLYDSLHCYVRWNLTKKYGADVVPPGKPIPAHLLGNIWAQEWGNVYDVVKPADTPASYDLTEILKARKEIDEIAMVRYGEGFFTSLGFAPLPKTFWERSLFTQPRDRDVVCHASAWDIDDKDDLRVKMCIRKTADYFTTIHHELGHNFYQRAYNTQPFLYKNSANDGFHEAIGDTIALSVTPSYLVKLGLIDKEPPASADIALLLRDALDKVAFLPFGIMIDKWRWKVFSGEVTPADYNKAWWDLRRQYQGVAAPNERSESDFDPGAKYHIAANVPYARYFLARILQFQFHRALCETSGYKGPLNRCSIYGNKAAGERLAKTLAMGQSRPWPDALEALTGQRRMDATAIVDYFAPLKSWLDQQNKGQTCGW